MVCRKKNSPASFSMPGINLPAYRNLYSTTLPTMCYNFKCIRTNFKGSFRTTLPALKLYPINGHSLSVFLVTKVIKDLPLSDPLTIMYAYDQMNDFFTRSKWIFSLINSKLEKTFILQILHDFFINTSWVHFLHTNIRFRGDT